MDIAPKPIVFEPGSAVEVSINSSGFRGSWFSGTVISRVESNIFLVQYHHNLVVRAVVNVHQLRPLPPPESYQEFKSGDKVDAFWNHRWWVGHVTEDLGRESLVFLRDLKEVMAIRKELLRAHRQWINHSWVPQITDNNRDRISELPDSILLHTLNFMNTKYAVQTCVLNKRWKDLCKRLNNLTYCPDPYLLMERGAERFRKFATWVLSRRDDAYSLLNLTLHLCWTEPELLDKVIKYVLFHDVQQLTMELYSGFRPDLESLPLIFCSQSLTSLKLCIIRMNYPLTILPKSLHLPALKSLYLQGFNFTASNNDSAEPFSNCHVLKTLVLIFCSLHNDAQVLCISNSTLSSLTISEGRTYQIVLSTPNLTSFTIRGSGSLQLFSTCNLSFLGEVYIDVSWDGRWSQKCSIISSNIIRWLVVLAYVKKLTFSRYAFQIILHDFSNPISIRPEPPSFVRLESLKMIKLLSANVSDEKVNTVVEYLLRDSPMARVEILGEY